MINRAMEQKLREGDCIDISKCRRTSTGDYVLEAFVEDIDYCDAGTEEWIQSIGKLLRPLPSVMADGERLILPIGSYLASTSTRHYSAGDSESIECVFLR